MYNTSEQTKRTARRKRHLLVAGAVAVGVIIVCLLWRSTILPNRFGPFAKSVPIPTPAGATALPEPRMPPTFGTVTTAQIMAAQNSRPATSDWQLFLDKLTRLLKGPKVEVCGLSDFEAAKYIAGDTEADSNALSTTLSAVLGKLKQSENPRDQALGLYVQAHLADWVASSAEQGKFRICEGDFDCIFKLIDPNKRLEIKPEVRAPGVAPLVKLALSTRDPAIIAAAIYTCRGDRTDECATISYADWVAVEPDNAAVWLLLADKASSNNELPVRENALRRAAAASGYDLRVPSLASVWNAELTQAQPPLVLSSIGLQLASSQINTTLTPVNAMVSYCRPDGLDDAHKKLCDTLANKLLDQDDSVIGLSIATFIGKKIGWDAVRLQTLREQKGVALGMMGDMSSGANMYSCENLSKRIQETEAWLSKTDRAIVRDRIANSGMSFAELVEKYRAWSPGAFK